MVSGYGTIYLLANRPQKNFRLNRLGSDKKNSTQYNKRLSVFGPLIRPFASPKHPLWRAHPNLSFPIETVTPTRNLPGSWVRSRNSCFTSPKRLPAEPCHWLICPTKNRILNYFPTNIVSAKGDCESHRGTKTEKGPGRCPNNHKNDNWTSKQWDHKSRLLSEKI